MSLATEAPTTRRDVEEEFRERAEREWFKDHRVAEYSAVETPGGTKIELLKWRRPGTSVYGVDYLVVGNKLFVSGDVYEATYAWSSHVSLAWIAGLHQDYFASKCMASPHGREFRTWDRRTAEQAVRDHFEERAQLADVEQKACPACGGIVDVPLPDPRRVEFDELGGWRALESDDHEWVEWLRSHGYSVFGDDHWEWTAGVGRVLDPACVAHLVGLKMAMASLQTAEVAG